MALKLQKDDATITVKDDDLGVPNGDAEVTYTVRTLTREKYKEIIAGQTKRKPNPRTRAMEDVTDWAAVSEDLIDYALVGWTGILWEGEPAPCEREMKLRLDAARAAALLDRAGTNQLAEAVERKTQSFRAPA